MNAILAFTLCTICGFNIAIGDRAGWSITTGSCNILIGDGVDTPTPETNYAIIVEGKIYPNSVRSEPWFQKVARDKARQIVLKMMPEELAGGDPPFRGSLRDALNMIDRMEFYEKECAPAQS
jgi:hypothetical protein